MILTVSFQETCTLQRHEHLNTSGMLIDKLPHFLISSLRMP